MQGIDSCVNFAKVLPPAVCNIVLIGVIESKCLLTPVYQEVCRR